MQQWYQFSENDWTKIQKNWLDWWNHDLDRSLLVIEAAQPAGRAAPPLTDPHLTQFDSDFSPDHIIFQIEQELDKIHYFGDAFPKWFPNFGAGFLAALLGSTPEYNNKTTWFHPPPIFRLASLEKPIDQNQLWYKRFNAIYTTAAQRWGGEILIAYTDIGGNLDILASLMGSQQLLTAIMDKPDEIKVYCKHITRRWLELYQLLNENLPKQQKGQTCWAPIWAPGTTYMLQSDLSIMISPRMFNQFVLPDIEACCDVIEYPFYHLDGPGAVRHIDALLSIKKLRGIQWIPGAGAPPPEEWLPLLEKIRNAGKLCQVYVSVEGALAIAKSLGQKGFLFSIGDGRNLTLPEAERCLEAFNRLTS